ncbi:hypothetical protein AB0395_06110 [Streptosporangium sp. NPDC051023]|uniref:hypothetical protein n=1 Tax=Streptosporangium sp. NPDC051023 TaxID=3155410 RepID=UPI00344BA2D1
MKLAKMGIAAIALIGATAVPLSISTPANAASCGGSRIEHIAVNSGGSTYGYLDVYYSSSTGRNCARLDRVVNYGTKKGMILQLWACQPGSNPCGQLDYESDSGQFGQYAGPVSVYGKGRCIQVQGSVQDASDNWANLTTPIFHC